MKKRLSNFFFLCQCLRSDLTEKDSLWIHNMIHTDAVYWEQVIELANKSFVTPALWTALLKKGMRDGVPLEVADYLDYIHEMNRIRNNAIEKQLVEIIRVLNRLGIEPLLLKGAALLLSGAFEDSAARMMTDIDLLVETDDVKKILQALSELKYQIETPHFSNDNYHLPPIFRSGNPAPIEIHARLLHKFYDTGILKMDDVWKDSMLVKTDGLSWRQLSPSHAIIYNVIHSEIQHGNFGVGKISLRDLLDLVLISRYYSDLVDWDYLVFLTNMHDLQRIFVSYLYLASKLLGFSTPISSGTVFARFHYFRCLLIAHGWDRLQLLGTTSMISRIFSAKRMCEDFGCTDSFIDIAKMRVGYFNYLSKKWVFGPKRAYLLDKLMGKQIPE